MELTHVHPVYRAPISSYDVWRQAFDRFSDARERAGVQRYRIQHPVADSQYVVLALDFPSSDKAERFRQFLQENVWSSSASSPALSGTPQTRILEVIDEG